MSVGDTSTTLELGTDTRDSLPQKPHSLRSLCVCQSGKADEIEVAFSDLQTCATTDPPCHLCMVYQQVVKCAFDKKLSGIFDKSYEPLSRTDVFGKLIVRLRNSDTHRYLQLATPRSNHSSFGPPVLIFRYENEEVNVTVNGSRFPPGALSGQSTESETGFSRIETWLNECLTTHDCGDLEPRKFPRRLLDLGENQIRLRNTKGFERPYVALSHCWGDPKHPRLISTVTTIKNFESDIPWDIVPKTFQDAITICRKLGIRYLWIDTLCILQQHHSLSKIQVAITKEDFAKENSTMADIYQGSYFTISADISTNMNSGIFSSPTECLPINAFEDSGKPITLYARVGREKHSRKALKIHTRGWTFQESLLPSRVIHFGETEITWRCRKVEACECGATRNDVPLARTQGTQITMGRIGQEFLQGPRELSEALEWWEGIVSKYTCRKLSNPCDKLPALSGLAQIYTKATSDIYLAGLWKQSLFHDLCWYNWYWNDDLASMIPMEYRNRAPKNPAGYRPNKSRGPSWSWVSIDLIDGFRTCFWSPEIRNLHPLPTNGPRWPVCTLYNVTCMTKTDDPTGEVGDCSLEIGVKLISADISLCCRRTDKELYQHAWTINNINGGMQIEYCVPDCKMEDDGLKEGDRVYCAPILEAENSNYPRLGCILLKHIQGCQYRRIGFCTLSHKTSCLCKKALDMEISQTKQGYTGFGNKMASKHGTDTRLLAEIKDLDRITIV